jgi:hypothetical protein
MAMGRKWKMGLGIGCGAMLLIVVGILGMGTWYAGRINEEYKEVKDSEKALLAATEGDRGYMPPPGGVPSPDRIEIFLAVREDLDSWRGTMATASRQFAVDQDRQRSGGLKDVLKLFNTGSDLMPTYAGFWTARNESLLAHEMGPGEYAYIYMLVYHAGPLDPAFDPYRDRLAAAFDAEVDPVELIFQKDSE